MIGAERCHLVRRDTSEGAGAWNDEGFFEPAPRPEASTLDDLPSFLASVQPATPDEIQALPEGVRARETLALYTTTELRTATNPRLDAGEDPIPAASPRGAVPADLVIVRGEVYEVVSIERWARIRPHYKAIAVRADESLLEVLGGEA